MRWWWRWWGPLCTKTNMHSWIFIVLAHWNNCPRINMPPNLDTLSWFRANQSLIRAVASLEKDNLVVFYYLSASEIWLDKRDGFGGSGHLRWQSTVVDLLEVKIEVPGENQRFSLNSIRLVSCFMVFYATFSNISVI